MNTNLKLMNSKKEHDILQWFIFIFIGFTKVIFVEVCTKLKHDICLGWICYYCQNVIWSGHLTSYYNFGPVFSSLSLSLTYWWRRNSKTFFMLLMLIFLCCPDITCTFVCGYCFFFFFACYFHHWRGGACLFIREVVHHDKNISYYCRM